ncbi:uncharacterized protein LOC118426354 [Branchiostoma floridae]|uniref:Uncharacterized protein LOC118426354 n=1 Tax=Branchiostoma floridae TaxID=7739 RepID=C3YCY3_BRAFL|nr:uncharacterized protein LOC118426354 [Branchiostoma floridae]|eukprot:XP_002605924.1 hypothetical protein BRAFLDRAFT_87402 [Branchiostoma floridae]
MTSYDEKKTLPPAEVLPGGVFPDEIAALKKKARGENASRLKIGIAIGSVVLVILAVVGGTLLGLHLNRKPNVVVRSVQLAIDDEIMEETVEVDKEKDTETFRTVSSNGTSFVIRDMKTSLSAYRFDGDEKCYILYESLEEVEDTAKMAEDMEQMEEGELDAAERRPETFLTVDKDRGVVERSELSEGIVEFCEGLRTHWAVKSSFQPTPTPGATVEEEEEEKDDEANSEMEVHSGTNGTTAVKKREKRLVATEICRRVTRMVCNWACKEVCSRRGRRGLLEGKPEQEVKKRAKRGWFINLRRVVDAVVSFVCRVACGWTCGAVTTGGCILVFGPAG